MLGKIEDERRGWQRMRWLDGINGHEFEQTLEDSEGQGSLACCNPWGRQESDMTYRLNISSSIFSILVITVTRNFLFAKSNGCFWVLIFIDLLASLSTVDEMLYEMLLFGFFLDGVFLPHFLYCSSHPGPLPEAQESSEISQLYLLSTAIFK